MLHYKEILEQYQRVQDQLRELETDYGDNIKGDVYTKRKMQLLEKLDHYKKQALAVGTIGNICHIQGKRSRPSIKNPRVMIQERFNLYFTNVREDEVSALVKLHVQNVVHYTTTFIRPGIIITTS